MAFFNFFKKYLKRSAAYDQVRHKINIFPKTRDGSHKINGSRTPDFAGHTLADLGKFLRTSGPKKMNLNSCHQNFIYISERRFNINLYGIN